MSDRPASHPAVLAGRVGWLILPVTVAGMVHVIVLKTDVLHCLAVPIDGDRQWRARPLLGPNKTWRGVLLMTGCTAVFTQLQALIERGTFPPLRGYTRDRLQHVSRDYRTPPWIAGCIMGLSCCVGELPNSFVKRRLGIPPGALSPRMSLLQYVIDQADSVIGCLLTLRFHYRPRRGEMALAFLFGFTLHMGVDRLLFVIGVKRRDGSESTR